jgi:hypothetical protein
MENLPMNVDKQRVLEIANPPMRGCDSMLSAMVREKRSKDFSPEGSPFGSPRSPIAGK